jgi:hypothetical protein
MKKIFCCLLLSLLFAGCSKMECRVKNDFSADLTDFAIGDVSYGTVESGSTTPYREVEEGSHDVTVADTSIGTASFNKSGGGLGKTFQFTLTISSEGAISIQQD